MSFFPFVDVALSLCVKRAFLVPYGPCPNSTRSMRPPSFSLFGNTLEKKCAPPFLFGSAQKPDDLVLAF